MTNYNFVCTTCKTIEQLGCGSFTGWMVDSKTVEEFDAYPVPQHVRNMAKNQRLRDCLVRHAGHEHRCHSEDFCSVRESDGALMLDYCYATDNDVLIANYAEYRDVTPQGWLEAMK